jgi:hypothetical protein
MGAQREQGWCPDEGSVQGTIWPSGNQTREYYEEAFLQSSRR